MFYKVTGTIAIIHYCGCPYCSAEGETDRTEYIDCIVHAYSEPYAQQKALHKAQTHENEEPEWDGEPTVTLLPEDQQMNLWGFNLLPGLELEEGA
jgi:hypothetical protein